MAFTRPISSQTSLIILKRIYDHYGIDHLYSLMGSILQTGSDTTFICCFFILWKYSFKEV